MAIEDVGEPAHFVPVAGRRDLPRAGKLVCQAGEYEILLCSVGESVYAIENRCSHMAKPLAQGRIIGTTITCPFHGAQFDVRNGSPLGFPAVHAIRCFAVRASGDTIEVATQPTPAPGV
jgi:nitrite reductase/ring-hydroxylating ferredoxin subunit